MKNLAAAMVVFAMSGAATAQPNDQAPSIADLGFLIGQWEGRATLYDPRDDLREPIQETVRATCTYILKSSYIQCDTTWTRPDNRTRTFRLHFNYNAVDGGYQTLFIYDNWPRSVSYLLHYDDTRSAYIGFDKFSGPNGVGGQERVEWRVSPDEKEIRSVEFNHFDTEPDGYWPKTFEFVWQKGE